MSVLYGICSLVALALIGACLVVDKKRDVYLLFMFISVFACNLAFLLISVSKTVEFALNANRLAYLGQVFLPFFLLMMIMELCRVKYPKCLSAILCAVSAAMLLIAASPGIVTWYYKSAHIETIDGTTYIIREHGHLHTLYYAYLIGYLVADVFIVVQSIIKRRIASMLCAFFLLAAVFCNIVVWLIEQLLPRGFEFLSLSYIFTEVFILLLYGILQEYDPLRSSTSEATVAVSANRAVADTDEGWVGEAYTEKASSGNLFTEADIDMMIAGCETLNELTAREKDTLRGILANKRRKAIADELCLSESTIKKYTSSVYRKLAVNNRLELFAKLKHYIR